ncbi:FAD/NAD(P)-binding domain-containing protein [Melanogaster broomeanus]|nr:FAD/NAD(P)-binding domain-containing protein [Melanogaster broomeanus]
MHFLRLKISSPVRRLATAATAAPSSSHHKIVVVGGGAGGIAVAAQIRRAFKARGQTLSAGDIAIVDPAQSHHYQPGWTLVGSGLSNKDAFKRSMTSVIPAGVTHHPVAVTSFSPSSNTITTSHDTLSYDYLVVATGLKVNFSAIPGLESALQQNESGVSSIYSYDTVDKVWKDIHRLQNGKAIFTQPVGAIKCAGAPQKIMWMGYSTWKTSGVLDAIQTTFATGAPSMFAVEKYSKALDRLRQERQVEGLFTHNLTSIDVDTRVAKFSRPDGTTVEREYDFLHVVPPQGPLDVIRQSPLADAAGWVEVNPATTQHVKFKNVFSLGDCSSMPNSKTAAAITSQAPVLVHNLLAEMDGKQLNAVYDGYASCPLLTGHNELMLCEFKYGGVPDETFAWIAGSQDVPRRAFYHLKKDVFPRAYFDYHMHGRWFGRKGLLKPTFT